MLGAFLVGYCLESLLAIVFFVAGVGSGAVALWLLSKAIDEDPALESCAEQLQNWLRWWNFLGGAQVFLFVWFPRGPFSGRK